ncbi:hypothetical protein OG423_32115 [Micromonospora zamorensis]|uniref:hypothetical protein n=1 Tax=Micromonospora zamorensis TaxID=709883 RepID=UPI00352AE96B|nr:hypothetical protein OG423_32115 [Micromonospora zamorensis]
MAAKDPNVARISGRVGGYVSWANTADPTARTAPARQAALDRFEREVDPDGTMNPVERARRARQAQKAHMARLALKSAQVRRAKAAGKRQTGADGGAAA